ncbi:MAG TPA: hypothetical protein VMV71_01005 [Candidatus Paceibacterota bacterium]|nr:hypothetical protein [Candidatus Paceibacterota bacterium]
MNSNEAVNAALDGEREAFERRAKAMSERNGNVPEQPVFSPQLPRSAKFPKKIKGKNLRKPRK